MRSNLLAAVAGTELVAGWQPADLPKVIARQQANLAARGWPEAYAFGRVNSPRE